MQRTTINLPHEIADALQEHIALSGYHSDSSYYLGLALYDLWNGRSHDTMAKLMRQQAPVRDAICARIFRAFSLGAKATKAGWLDELIETSLKDTLRKHARDQIEKRFAAHRVRHEK